MNGISNNSRSSEIKKRLTILVFAYVYPPDAGSGTYRTLYFANNWAEYGDNVIVITVKVEDFTPTALVDRGLSKDVHSSIEIVRASAKRPLGRLLALRDSIDRSSRLSKEGTFKKKIGHSCNKEVGRNVLRSLKDIVTDLLSCPDQHVGWILGAVRCGYRIVKSRKVDCIYATGGPWSGLLGASLLHRLCNIPLFLDFRDPWVSNPNIGERSVLSRFIQGEMEAFCIRSARKVIANTAELKRDFIRRYSWVDAKRFVTVTNGFETVPWRIEQSNDCFRLVHAGALYQSRIPLNFLKAVFELCGSRALAPEKIRIQLVGGFSEDDDSTSALIGSKEMRDILEIVPRVSHEEVMKLQQKASVLLIFQAGFPLQVPRKLFEYLSIGRPILAVTESGSATARMIRELNAGCVVEDNVDSIKKGILTLFERCKLGKTLFFDTKRIEAFNNRHLSHTIRDLMLGP